MTSKQASEIKKRAAKAADRIVNSAQSESNNGVPQEKYEALRREVERTVIQVARASERAAS